MVVSERARAVARQMVSVWWNSWDREGAINQVGMALDKIHDEHMTGHEFANRIRSLYNIDYSMLPDFSDRDWRQFRDDPPRYIANCADRQQLMAILRAMESRQDRKCVNVEEV